MEVSEHGEREVGPDMQYVLEVQKGGEVVEGDKNGGRVSLARKMADRSICLVFA